MADVWKAVADHLNRLNTIIQQLTRLDKEVGSNDDGSQLRSDMKRLRDEGQDTIKSSKDLLTQPYDRAQRAKHDKLQAQLADLSAQFEKVAKVTIKKEMDRRLSQVTPSPSSNSNSLQPPRQQVQTQAQAANVDELLVQERNNDIKALEKELTELSEVFVDVMKLTQEQGEDLQTVHNNTSSADAYVEKGNTELTQASIYACSYRKKMFALSLIVLIVIVVVIVIAVVVSQKNKNK